MAEGQEEVGEVGTPGGQLVEDIHSDQVTGELQVSQVDAEPVPDESHQEVNTGDVDPRHLRSDGDEAPEPGVLTECSPLLTDPGAGVDEGAVGDVAQDEEEHLVWTSLNVTQCVLPPHVSRARAPLTRSNQVRGKKSAEPASTSVSTYSAHFRWIIKAISRNMTLYEYYLL